MDFSTFYDIFQKDVDYTSLLKPILPFLDKHYTILDAGCGSGHIMLELHKLGYQVIGVDKDESMLSRAYKNFDTFGIKPNLFVHDLRKPLQHQFHQIISLLDVFHYFKGIKGIAKNLYQALYPNGRLILDLYQKPQNYEEAGHVEDMSYQWSVQTKNQSIIHDIHTTQQGETNIYQVKQYYDDPTYYINILKSVGFKVQTFMGFDDRKLYVVCTK